MPAALENLQPDQEEELWLCGWVECLNCGYEWVAVRPAETHGIGLECPRCGEMDGQGFTTEGIPEG